MATVYEEEYLPPLKIKVEKADKHYGPEDGAYKNNSQPRGAVFIANYMNFDNKLKRRVGSDINVSHLSELFEQMEYNVNPLNVITDKTLHDTKQALDNFRRMEMLNQVDSLIVIISSHGKGESFFTSDGQLLHHKEVCEMFSNTNCKAMEKKPKLFMFQFCRDKSQTCEEKGNGGKRNRDVTCTYICMSTSQGQKAYRTEDQGALFFYHACDVFMKFARDTDLDTLMKKVDAALHENQKIEIKNVSFKKSFHFNPPLKNEEEKEAFIFDTSTPPPVKEDKKIKDANICGITTPTISLYHPDEKIRTRERINTDSDDSYIITSHPKGKVLIINNSPVYEEDVQKLRNIFTDLHFEVLNPHANLSHGDLLKEIQQFSQMDHNDSAVLVFYGQGFEDHIVCSDNIPVSYKDIVNLLNDSNYSRLAGKPKILIIHANQTDSYHHDESQKKIGTDMDSEIVCKDTLLFSVEVEGNNGHKGSLLTDALFQILLAKQNSKMELMPLLRLVDTQLEEWSESGEEEYFVVTYNFRFQKNCFLLSVEHDSVDSELKCNLEAVSVCEPITIPKTKQPFVNECIYLNTSWPRGKAIIISFTKYDSHTLPRYLLHDEDIKFKQVSEQLGYQVNILKNRTSDEIKCALTGMKEEESLKEMHSLMVIAHGFAHDLNHFYDIHGNTMSVLDVFHPFSDSNCPNMKGKPKIFFFHMTVLEEHLIIDISALTPTSTDVRDSLAIYLVTTKLDDSDDHPKNYLDIFCDALKYGAQTRDLSSIAKEAEEKIMNHCPGSHARLIVRSIGFEKDFYFNPKCYKE